MAEIDDAEARFLAVKQRLQETFARLPYTGVGLPTLTQTTPLDLLERVADNLGSLRGILEGVAGRHQRESAERDALKSQRLAVGQFLREALADAERAEPPVHGGPS